MSTRARLARLMAYVQIFGILLVALGALLGVGLGYGPRFTLTAALSGAALSSAATWRRRSHRLSEESAASIEAQQLKDEIVSGSERERRGRVRHLQQFSIGTASLGAALLVLAVALVLAHVSAAAGLASLLAGLTLVSWGTALFWGIRRGVARRYRKPESMAK